MRKPSKLLKTQKRLNRASWSEFIKIFNKRHNSHLMTSLGVINVKVDED